MSLRSLSDQQILSRIQTLTARERALTLAVLLHLNELERRKLHLKLGYSSMFDYCTSGLGYSASAASRRIRTARCVARFPEVYELLRSNEVNVSTVAQVSRILTAENKDAVLSRIRGKSQREVEAVVAEFEPLESLPKDRVRTVVVRVRAESSSSLLADRSALAPAARLASKPSISAALPNSLQVSNGMSDSDLDHDRNGRTGDQVERAAESDAAPARHTLVQFAAGDEFMAKLERVRSLYWHQLPASASLQQVFELALDVMIKRKDPQPKRAKRVRAQRSSHATNPRYIPAETKRIIRARDDEQCTFVGSDGRRCASKRALQIDHVQPVARGGRATIENLRLLCAYHNRFEAGRLLGRIGRDRTYTPPNPMPR